MIIIVSHMVLLGSSVVVAIRNRIVIVGSRHMRQSIGLQPPDDRAICLRARHMVQLKVHYAVLASGICQSGKSELSKRSSQMSIHVKMNRPQSVLKMVQVRNGKCAYVQYGESSWRSGQDGKQEEADRKARQGCQVAASEDEQAIPSTH